MTNFTRNSMTDQKLFLLCKKYGENARIWRQKFLGLLPEVQRRGLWRVRGFESVFEFAARLAGVSGEQVRNVLNLERRLMDKPALHQALTGGAVSVNKLARVVSIATVENQEDLLEMVRSFSKNALETWVRDVKNTNVNGSQQPIFGAESLPGQTLNFELAEDVVTELNNLQAKGFDVNRLMREMLEQRRVRIAAEKEEVAEDCEPASGRYVPARVKKVLMAEHGDKCSIPECGRLAAEIHHTRRFALARSHDPRFLAPLCAGHHELANAVDGQTGKSRRNR